MLTARHEPCPFLLKTLVLTILIPLGSTSHVYATEYLPVDASTLQSFTVLKGYLKRRNILVKKEDMEVKPVETSLIFCWKTKGAERFFRVEKNRGAWVIEEVQKEAEVIR